MVCSKLTDIIIYPIKSTAGVSLSDAWVEEKGLAFDRRFVVADLQGQFITARTEPRLTLIQALLIDGGMKLVAPGMPILTLSQAKILPNVQPVNVWKDTISAQQCSTDVNQWISQYLAKDCQLMFFGSNAKRRVKNRLSQVSFADGYPLLLISQASLHALNERASSSISMAQFRPNIVVDDCDAFAEDTWKHIRIGEVEFEVVKPCSRCIFTTVDPTTGEKNNFQEPLKTLKTFRQGSDRELYFGQNVVPLNEGKISIHDHVEVLAWQTPEDYPDHSSIQNANKTKPLTQQAAPVTAPWPAGESKALRCITVIHETHDVKTFILATDDNTQVDYLAGQHLPISLEIEGKNVKRNYTLSSAPTRPNMLAITVKRVVDGVVSNCLHDHLKVGDYLSAQRPAGNFHLGQLNTNKLVLLTAGSGITPALSILRTLVDQQNKTEVVFFHSAHTESDLIARQEIDLLSKQHGNCQIIYTLTQHALPNWSGLQGRVSKDMLASISNLPHSSVFVCGPQAFMVSVKEQLLALGLPESQYMQESFGARKLSTAAQTKNTHINILFDSWNVNVAGNGKQSILEQAEEAGLILPYSCRAGYCGSCKVKLESGTVRVDEDCGLMPDEIKQGYILACSCTPESDVVISSN